MKQVTGVSGGIEGGGFLPFNGLGWLLSAAPQALFLLNGDGELCFAGLGRIVEGIAFAATLGRDEK